MTAESCFNAKAAIGRVSRKAADRVKAIIQSAMDAEARGDPEAAREAMRQALAIAQHEATARQARTVGNAEAQLSFLRENERMRADFDTLRAQNKSPVRIPGLTFYQGKASELGLYIQSKLYGDRMQLGVGNTWNNVYDLARSLRGEAHAKFRDVIRELRPKAFGLKRDAARELDLVDALYGQARTPEMKALAEATTKTLEFTRGEFNKAAGYEAIPERKDYGLPNPSMAAARVQAWSAEAFIDRVAPLLNRDKMIDFRTGQPIGDARLREVLRQVYETGRSGGLEGGPSAGFVGEGPLSDRRSAPRTLVFKDGASWNAFNELFGSGHGPFDAIVSHLNSVTHDAAIMRVFGPDPEISKRFLMSMLDREANRLAVQGDETSPKKMAAAVKANEATRAGVEGQRKIVENGWADMTGLTGTPVNMALASRMADLRHALGAAQLGTSTLSALSDLGLTSAAARVNGLPAMDIMRSIVATAARKESEIDAAQHGLVADTLIHGALEADQYMGEMIRSNMAAKLSTAVLRASGHRVWTAWQRDGFAMEFMAKMANAVRQGTAYDALPFRDSLARYGIDAKAWGEIAKVAPAEPRPGAFLLRPMDVRATPGLEAHGDALGRMVQQEMSYTALEADPLTRRIVLGGTRPGTASGELARSLALYRSWPVTTFNLLLNRALARGWDGSRLGHGAFTFLTMTMLGMMAVQMKQIVAGKDPYSLDLTTPDGQKAWFHGLIQGGGLGVFGDMIAADKTAHGNSWASMFAGPIADLGETVLGQVLLGNVQKAIEGKRTDFLGEAAYAASRYLPGSNLWWGKLAFNRAVTDQLLTFADEKTPERFARIEAAAQKNFGQGTWWRRGQMTPDRGPDLSAVFGR